MKAEENRSMLIPSQFLSRATSILDFVLAFILAVHWLKQRTRYRHVSRSNSIVFAFNVHTTDVREALTNDRLAPRTKHRAEPRH